MTDRPLTAFDYVNQPYARVREALLANPYDIFRKATAAAKAHAATLHVHFAGLEIGTDVTIDIVGVAHDSTYDRPTTRIALEWQAATNPRMYPAMKATLFAFPLSPTETQLELRGSYEPPLGKLGGVIDAAAGHRLAAASVTSFIKEVAGWLRAELAVVDRPMPSPPTVDDATR